MTFAKLPLTRSVFVFALAVVASANAAEKSTARRGEELAQTYCARCHATGADDASPHPSAPKFRDLHRRWPVEMLQEALTEGLMTGHPEMPEFQFTSEDAAAFVTYLKNLAPKAAQ